MSLLKYNEFRRIYSSCVRDTYGIKARRSEVDRYWRDFKSYSEYYNLTGYLYKSSVHGYLDWVFGGDVIRQKELVVSGVPSVDIESLSIGLRVFDWFDFVDIFRGEKRKGSNYITDKDKIVVDLSYIGLDSRFCHGDNASLFDIYNGFKDSVREYIKEESRSIGVKDLSPPPVFELVDIKLSDDGTHNVYYYKLDILSRDDYYEFKRFEDAFLEEEEEEKKDIKKEKEGEFKPSEPKKEVEKKDVPDSDIALKVKEMKIKEYRELLKEKTISFEEYRKLMSDL